MKFKKKNFSIFQRRLQAASLVYSYSSLNNFTNFNNSTTDYKRTNLAAHSLPLHHHVLSVDAVGQRYDHSVDGSHNNNALRRHGHQSGSHSDGDCGACEHWRVCDAGWGSAEYHHHDKSNYFGSGKFKIVVNSASVEINQNLIEFD